ncbi:MAG: LEA type 2 family protein [Prevotellaceae bacterium]|nr:LEA type 2 family protein [Prevotellaceae bacterium]
MNIKHFCIFSLLILAVQGCDVARQISGAYNMINCKYEYNSVSALTLSGMDLSKGVSASNIPGLLSLLAGKGSTVPLNFTVNLDVTNPNQSEALLHGMSYILNIDNVQFATGSMNRSLNIPPGNKKVLPLNIGVDLAALLSGNSRDAVVNIVKNFIGIGSRKTNVSLQIKPTFMIGGQPVTQSSYIPVNFTFGGK